MRYDNPVRLIRELKGAPLSVLFALALVKMRVSNAWLERATGYTDKPISQALAYLEEIGLVDQSSAGWQLTGKARQLPLPLQQLEPENELSEPAEIEPNPPEDVRLSRNNSDSTTTTINLIDLKDSVVVGSSPGSRKNSDSQPPPVDKSAESVDKNCQILDALASAGIGEPKRSELARLEWVTPQAISAWESELRQRKRGRYTPGLLIRILESGEPPPVPPPIDGGSYVSGEFSDFIEH